MNNQNQTDKTNTLAMSMVDELLVLKKEIVEKIENVIALIEQNLDRRLEDGILFLAGSWDGENAEDGMGFHESDARFGHYLAGWLQRGEKLTLKQAEAALGMMQRYSQSQLEPNGYSLPTAWEEISHQYCDRIIEGELPGVSAVLKTGDRIVLSTGEYCDTYIAAYYPDETIYENFTEYVEDIWDYGREGGSVNVLLDATPRLMGQVAHYIEHGYRCYVDPDIEAAYYLWEQERQRMISEREPVLPLYAVPPDALRLDAVPLESERGVDYQELRRLLQRQDWYKADQATDQLFVNFLCQRGEELRAEDGWTIDSWSNMDIMKQFPCADLRTIDQLWVAASGGKFGFSVQKKIWLGLGLTNLDVKGADLDKFRDAVGWLLLGKHIHYRKSSFDLSTAPNGHFPRWGWDDPAQWGWVYGSIIAAAAFQKAEICNLV